MGKKATARVPHAAEAPRWERPAAAPRVTIVQVLGLADGPLTVRQIEHGVTELIRVADVATIEEHLQELIDAEHVEKVAGRKTYALSPSGREMYESARPFSKS